jgi:hypothetical protein
MIDIVSQKMDVVEEMIRDGKIPTQDKLNAVLASLGKILTLLILERGCRNELRPLFQKYLTLCNLRLESTGSGNTHWIW